MRVLSRWLSERVPVEPVLDYFGKKSVPRHGQTFWYLFGGLALFFFSVQVFTGILLALYYVPAADQAHESVVKLINEVPYGWFIRSVHSWSANLMIATVFVHMFSTFFMRSYRKPRELMWVSGVLLLFIMFGFAFTGYLLPWDTMAYFATLIGTEVPSSVPFVGDFGVGILKGSQEVGPETLTRMYSIHVIILPLFALMTMSFHLMMNQVLGSSIPIGTRPKMPPIPFFPNFFYRDILCWTTGLAILIAFATLLPVTLGEKADPLASAPLGIKPEWYFLPLYQSLKMVPSTIFSVTGELVVNVVVGLSAGFWLLVPFIDRKASKEQKARLFTIIGVLLVAYLALTICLAYLYV